MVKLVVQDQRKKKLMVQDPERRVRVRRVEAYSCLTYFVLNFYCYSAWYILIKRVTSGNGGMGSYLIDIII